MSALLFLVPGKRMLSSSTPTIVAKDGRLVLVTGCNGGRTIITSVLQVLLEVIDRRAGIAEAVDAPRVHHQWLPDVVQIEPGALSPATVAALERMGHRVREVVSVGAANSILVDTRTGFRYGVPDRRGPADGLATAQRPALRHFTTDTLFSIANLSAEQPERIGNRSV